MQGSEITGRDECPRRADKPMPTISPRQRGRRTGSYARLRAGLLVLGCCFVWASQTFADDPVRAGPPCPAPEAPAFPPCPIPTLPPTPERPPRPGSGPESVRSFIDSLSSNDAAFEVL